MNLFIGEMYLAIILTGNAFKSIYRKLNLTPVSLNRSLEDSVTLTNYIIPWGIEGAFAANTLGVPVINFLPFASFSFICPILSILSGVTGIGLKKNRLNLLFLKKSKQKNFNKKIFVWVHTKIFKYFFYKKTDF